MLKIELTLSEADAILNLIHHTDGKKNASIKIIEDKLINAQNEFEEISSFMDECPYELSDNQKRFVADCTRANLDVRWDYSGRGMIGKHCPSVCTSHSFFISDAKDIRSDHMGMDIVIYCPR